MVFHRCHHHVTTTAGLLATVFLAGILGGCGDEGASKKPVTQLAAKVNSDEISIHQVNAVLAQVGTVPPEVAPKVRREVLDRLVDEQLAVEQALKKNMDRSPDVVQAMEAARREVLARAYLEKVVAGQPKLSAAEIASYYNDNPFLFAKRRVYSLQELAFPTQPELLKSLRDMVATGKSLDEIANWLRGKEVKFASNAGLQPAEQVPLDVLPKLQEIRDGQLGVVDTPATTYVLKVAASQPAPLDESAATPRIRLFLANQRGAEAVKKELGQLRAQAKIEYLGEFSTPVAAAPGAAGVKVASTTEPPRAGAGNPEQSSHEARLSKGVAGLK